MKLQLPYGLGRGLKRSSTNQKTIMQITCINKVADYSLCTPCCKGNKQNKSKNDRTLPSNYKDFANFFK